MIGGITSKSAPTPAPRAEAEKVASQFEAIFIQQIVSKMREGTDYLGESEMFGSGPGSDTYSEWFDTFMSEHISGSGRVGVADALIKHLDDLGQIEPAAEETKEIAA